MLKPWAIVFHSTLLHCKNEYLHGYRIVVDMCTSSFRALIIAYRLDAIIREVEMVYLIVREIKCKALSAILRIGLLR